MLGTGNRSICIACSRTQEEGVMFQRRQVAERQDIEENPEWVATLVVPSMVLRRYAD